MDDPFQIFGRVRGVCGGRPLRGGSVSPGDGDGVDAVLILQYAAGLIDLEDMAKPQAGNTNGDANIDGADAVLIMQYAAGIYNPAA